jgi:peptidoglycan/LPS O-acetylase OafA/YrhL
VFQNNVLHAVNGALWTLKVEIAFYIAVPLFVWGIRRVGAAPVIVATYLLSSLYVALVHGSLQHQLPGELRFFMAGTACYYGWNVLKAHWKPIAAAAVCVFVAGKFLPLGLLVPAAVGVLTICAGTFCYLGDFGRHGDFSYGVYILHFPIIQTLVQLGAFASSPWLALVGVVAITLTGAVILWHTIESRFLHRHGSVLVPSPINP